MKYLLLPFLLAATAARAQYTPPPPTIAELRAKEAAELEKIPPGLDALDFKNGFRQYKLGSLASEYPTLKPRGKDIYLAPGESLMIGDVKLMSLAFSAYKERLSAVMLSAMGEANCIKLLDVLTAQYGKGQESGYQKVTWAGNKVTMTYEKKTSVSSAGSLYTGPVSSTYCTVYIISNALAVEMNAENNAAAKKAAGDL